MYKVLGKLRDGNLKKMAKSIIIAEQSNDKLKIGKSGGGETNKDREIYIKKPYNMH